ncbi:MAG: class 1 fructose-bisphosphatase [Bryobacterales bacterium]
MSSKIPNSANSLAPPSESGGPPIITVQQHIFHQQQQHAPGAAGTFSWLLSGITLASKMIQAKVRRAGLLDVLGAAGQQNVQGEQQQKLDVYANQALLHCLGVRESVAILVSEENEEPVTLDHHGTGNYVVVFDPLDGSSNIDVNVSVGTIFSILRKPDTVAGGDPCSAVLQPGAKQVAAGYVAYGSSTILVYTAGRGVFGFTLDPSVGAYVLSHDNMRMPDQGYIYSVNEANSESFPKPYNEYLKRLRSGKTGRKYTSRYIGSMVADFHRTLIKGGVFLYPPTEAQRKGKLRLLYEANPIAFIAEQAGGIAIDGERRILDIQPESIHQRTPVVIGSRAEVEEFQRCRETIGS